MEPESEPHLKSKRKFTTVEETELQEKRNALRRRIDSWLEIRKIYISEISATSDEDARPDTQRKDRPESIPLGLPSALSPPLRSSTCLFGIADIERRIRLAQADDALSELRRQLRITMTLWDYKRTQVGPSQKASTRTYALINRFKEKTTRCVARYRSARAALLALDPDGGWKSRLQELQDADIRGPGKQDGETEGTCELSWIWLVERRCTSSDEAEVVEGVFFSCWPP